MFEAFGLKDFSWSLFLNSFGLLVKGRPIFIVIGSDRFGFGSSSRWSIIPSGPVVFCRSGGGRLRGRFVKTVRADLKIKSF